MLKRGRSVPVAEEAPLVEAQKKATKETMGGRSRSPVKPVRMKVVWEVCSGTGKTVKSYPYSDKAAAEAQTKALTRSTGRAHMLRETKVPME